MNLNNAVRTAIRSNAHWLLRLTSLAVLYFGLGGCASLADIAKEPPVLTLSSAGISLDGSKPTYTFQIYRNGLVRYHGEVNVNALGDRQAKITTGQVQQLVDMYKKINNLFELMRKEAPDLFGHNHLPYLFQLQYQGEVSEIRPGGYAHNLFIIFSKMVPFESWVC
ncbi:MAG: DUF6438 domain-containing protein [Methylovulum miyakonense]|uniref:DUF6438 domain-containing protein n=1 Tax=Methylovulum miyakonense TaxID=645578 RepID=UPI003BB6D619